MNNVVIIGGGPAGMMAAISASAGSSVVIIEKNNILGKKLNITGKGRCNITNACDVRTFLENVPTNPKFLYKALNTLTPSMLIDFFEINGLKTVTERGRRVFPESSRAADVTAVLKKLCLESGVKIIRGGAVRILTRENEISGVVYRSDNSEHTLECKKLVLATGGKSYPGTGSDGSGYKLASALGHKIIDPIPSLVPLETAEDWPKELTGLSLKNVAVSFKTDSKLLYRETGEMLFTHFGVSGPLVLSGSAYIKKFPAIMHIDMKPGLSAEELDKRILRDFEKYKNKDFRNSLDDLLPRAMIPVFIALSGIDGSAKVNGITRGERTGLVNIFKDLTLTIKNTRPIEEAIITNGGISVDEINPSTMESKLINGLYFAGEIIDVDAYTGGYNLQIAFSTGHLAGINI